MSKSSEKYHHPRRLSSGSACETCRKRKTKCDGGQPCAFCSSNGIKCSHRLNKLKKRKIFTVIDLELPDYYRQYPKYGSQQGSTPRSYNHDDQLKTKSSVLSQGYNRIPSITDQLSCHTFTIEAAYAL